MFKEILIINQKSKYDFFQMHFCCHCCLLQSIFQQRQMSTNSGENIALLHLWLYVHDELWGGYVVLHTYLFINQPIVRFHHFLWMTRSEAIIKAGRQTLMRISLTQKLDIFQKSGYQDLEFLPQKLSVSKKPFKTILTNAMLIWHHSKYYPSPWACML